MNKAQLIERVAEKAGWTKKDSAYFTNLLLDEIIACLNRGESVKLSGFGNFNVKHKEARTATNPITKEPIKVPAVNKVSFRPSDILKEKINA
ncbi:MAG: HU family DNA-binding protein [Bacilli bacterium]